jgi:hypothetical protein
MLVDFAGLSMGFAEAFSDYFINNSILALCGLAVIPVILHFLLRNKPKKLIFPALRLLQLRRKQNVRKLRLRHLWLLLLRILIILFLVLAIARPTLPSAEYSPSTAETLTTLAVILVCVGAYFGVMYFWQRSPMPKHNFAYRRTVLRSVVGAVMAMLLLLLVAWPYKNRVFAEINAPLQNMEKNLPVTAVFLFDGSLSMSYEKGNENPGDHNTRLKLAKSIADSQRKSFRTGSRVAVTSTGGTGQVQFLTDREAVRGRIDDLKINPLGKHTLDDLLRIAISRQEKDREKAMREFEADRFLREIYLFTDLAKNGWDKSPSKGISGKLSELSWLRVYVIDVGVEDPVNVAVSSLTLSGQAIRSNEQGYIDVKLTAIGESTLVGRVKLNLIDAKGEKVTRDHKPVSLEPGTEQTIQLLLKGSDAAFTQGEIEFEPSADGSKAFTADDTRYFTVAVQPRPKVLLVSDSRSAAYLWMQSLSPTILLQRERWFHCEYRPTSKLLEEDLSKYDVVYLINVRTPSNEIWNKLEPFVGGGGGLGVILGIPKNKDGQTQVSYLTPEALKILPASIEGQLEFVPPETLNLVAMDHPVMSTFKKFGSGDLTRMRVRKYWMVRPQEGSTTLVTYTHSKKPAALIVRGYGDGDVAMVTTSMGAKGDWNDLRSSGWAYVEFSHRLTQYLSGHANRAYNYQQGDSIRLQVAGKKAGSSMMLRKPPNAQVRISTSAKSGENPGSDRVIRLSERQTDALGNYQLLTGGRERSVISAFSLNVSSRQTDLTRMTTGDLDRVLGEGQYQLARDIESLNRAVTAGRYGVEIFDLAVLVMILVFCGELFVSNRFYDAEQAADHQ